MKKMHKSISDTQKECQGQIELINWSFADEVEQQYEIISSLAGQLERSESLRKQHGEKFIKIIDNAKKKYKECRSTLKHTETKLSKLEEGLE